MIVSHIIGTQQLSPATVVIGTDAPTLVSIPGEHVIVSHVICSQHTLEPVPGVVAGLLIASHVPCGAT